jgi:hypothetical protein
VVATQPGQAGIEDRRLKIEDFLNFDHCDLPFDLAQGSGELVEPFGICVLLFEIFYY